MPAIRATVLRPALELDGAHAGWLSSAEGGDAVGDVVMEAPEPGVQPKHLGTIHYEDIVVTFDRGMSGAFWSALQSVLRGETPRHSGAIIGYDPNFAERERLEFRDALITEISFPALDASSKDAARMTVTFAPDHTRRSAGSGTKIPAPPAGKQKGFTQASFRLSIDGLDAATTKVSKVAALTVGAGPADLEIPDLVFSLPRSAAGPLEKWHDEFVVSGNQQERTGSIDLLAADMNEVLLRVELSGLGIFKLAYDRIGTAEEQVANATASLYCEQIALASFPATT